MKDTSWARDEAQRLLRDELPRRWSHVQGVAQRAMTAGVATDERLEILIVAAWLHDVGYASELVQTGFHPVDGARYLRRIGTDEAVVGLVAHHSCALVEAELRGLQEVLELEFPKDPSLPHDELCFCDMTTSPDGQLVTVAERLREIRERYGPTDVVTQFVDRVEHEVTAVVAQVEARRAPST